MNAPLPKLTDDGPCDRGRNGLTCGCQQCLTYFEFLSEPPFCAWCGGTCHCDDWRGEA